MRKSTQLTPQQRRARDYLTRCRWAREWALGQAATLEELRALGMQVGRALTGLPGARGQTSQVERTVERIERCAQELETLTAQYLAQYRQLSALMDRMEDQRLAALLQMRELRQCSWQEIGQEMGVTERWVNVLYFKALQALGELLPAAGEAGPDRAPGGAADDAAGEAGPDRAAGDAAGGAAQEPPREAPPDPAPHPAPRPAKEPMRGGKSA